MEFGLKNKTKTKLNRNRFGFNEIDTFITASYLLLFRHRGPSDFAQIMINISLELDGELKRQ